jgi:peptidoglycan/LPS O-acetylase OafA/YrhL
MPYLPGLDGMRALAVIAVMVYHANSAWLPGGFLGVEVFFVISGYLITLLLIGEHERTGRVRLGQFWLRRARRLLPALFTMLILLTLYTVLFRREALGELRGDVAAGLLYVTNWYQIWVGQGYTAAGDFAPLRHLWSLAVEEQFYLLWPLAMVGLLGLGRRRLPDVARWLFLGVVAIYAVMAFLYYPGRIEPECAMTPGAYWHVGGRCISKVDTLYLSTVTRAGGVLLGAGFAMIWRPRAVMRGPIRRYGRLLDVVALLGLAGLAALCWYMHLVTPEGADPWLFRGGLLLTGVATLAVIAAVSHRRAYTGRVLGMPLLRSIGERSYGLYLYHWPIYQIIRGTAGQPLSVVELAAALAVTVVITEVSFRYIETPIRRGSLGVWWRRLQTSRNPVPRRMIATAGATCVAMSVFAGVNLATAELRPNEIEQTLEDGSRSVTDVLGLAMPTTAPPPTSTTPTSTTTTTVPEAPTTVIGVPLPTAVPTTAVATTVAAPPPTAPPTTAAPTTTVAPQRVARLAIGDSVMLGAAGDLAALGITVDAKVSRQMVDTIEPVRWLRAGGVFGDVVVVHLGTNGPIGEETMVRFFDELVDVPKVVVLTARAPRGWTAGNNARLATLPGRYPNVILVDWAATSNACPGDCFASDDIHLNAAGSRYYAAEIVRAIG